MKKPIFSFILLLILSSFQTQAIAEFYQDPGKKIAFQGTLYKDGKPASGEETFTFSIQIDANTSWTETQTNVQVVEGLYSVSLGSVTPLPANLFFGVNERELSIKIGNTELGRTKLFSPFAATDIKAESDLPRRVKIDNAKLDTDTVFYYDISADTKVDGFYQRGLQINMTGKGNKMAIRGNTISQAGDGNGAISIIGSATGAGAGTHEGVRGQAFGAGKFNSGVLGLAGGDGNGGTGFDGDGSYNTGVVGYGQNNAWGNTGITGYAVGTKGEDNVGVVGIANVRADDNDTQRNNTGVVARANGLGFNKALFAKAENGVENWAGWFEGDVTLRNGGNLSLFNEGNKRAEVTYFAPNDAGSILTYNHKNQRASLLGTASDRTGALFILYDSLQNAVLQLRAGSRPGDWPVDKRPHAQLRLNGPGGQNFYFGARVWEDKGADAPVFQMFGTPEDDGNGNTGKPELLYLTSETDAAGQQQPSLSLIKGPERASLNYDNTSALLGLVENRGKYRFEVNEQNSGVLKMMSSVDSVSVLLDSNGEKAGLIMLNDSLGRENIGLYAYPGGASYMKMVAGAENIGETRVTGQYWGGIEPFINLITRDADGNALGRAQMGKLQGNTGSGFRVTDANFRALIDARGDDSNGGDIHIQGPSTSNFWFGQKNWENSNLAYMALRGENGVDTGNGDGSTYQPDAISLEVSRYQDGADVGVLSLRRIKDGAEEGVSMDYFQLNNLINPTEYNINGENGNQIVSIRRRASNFGMAQFNNDNGDMRAEIGSFGDNSGFMQLYAPNGNKNMQLGGSDSNREFGMLKLFDNNGQDMFQLDVEDNNGNQVPFFRMGNPQKLDGNNYPQEALRFGLASDNNGDGKYSTYFNMEGPDAPLIQMGAHSWESNDGSNRARFVLFGSDQESDGNGGTYTPERANLSVGKDGGSNEYGILNLSNTTGGGFEVSARNWEDNNQGGYLTYTAIKSTVDVDDGNGGTYRPWLVSQEFHQDGNGNQFGTIRINSTNNTGFTNINDSNSGNIDISGSFNQSSDKRLKKNIKTLTSGLAMVNQLRGVRYNWKDETRKGDHIGFIAQEVEAVLPELVNTKDNGFKGVNYAEMTAVLVEAVKELSQQIDELKNENATLKAEASKVQSLEERLSRIEALLINPKTSNSDQK